MANNLKQYDGQQVLRSVFDPVNNRLRVDSEITGQIGQLEMILDHQEDSIRLGDGTNLTSVTASGELFVRDADLNTTLTSIDTKLVDGTDIGDVTINNTNTDPVFISESAHEADVSLASGQSMGSDFTSSSIDAINYSRGVFRATWTGADQEDATFVIEVSSDNTNWSQVGESGTAIGADSAETQHWQVLEFPARYMRMAYTANSVTTGTFDLTFAGRL